MELNLGKLDLQHQIYMETYSTDIFRTFPG